MTDNTVADSSQVDEDATSLADTTSEENTDDTLKESDDDAINAETNSSDNDDDAQEADSDESEVEDDELLKPLKKLRNENKNLRDRLKTAEARVTELEATTGDEAIINERDDLKNQLAALTTKVRTDRLNHLVTEGAREAGAIEPEAVSKLINVDDVTWNEEGEPTNVPDLVSKTKETYKRLFAVQGSANGGSRNQRHSEHEGVSSIDRLKGAYANND